MGKLWRADLSVGDIPPTSSKVTLQRDLAHFRKQLPLRKPPTLMCRAEILMLNNETWSWLEVHNVWQWLETENMRRSIILVKLYENFFNEISNLTNCQNQPMVCFPSRWLVMSDSVSIATHSQHLSLKSLCGSLTIQGVSVGNWALLVTHTDDETRVKRLCCIWTAAGLLCRLY